MNTNIDDVGLIHVTLSNISDRHGPITASFYVLFHMEDTFNVDGVPAREDHNLTLSSMMNTHVDVIAR